MADPNNWKGHWRKGVALMAMSKRSFRTKQAIEAFESCGACSTLPADKKSEVQAELNKARRRKEQQDAEVPHDTDILLLLTPFINMMVYLLSFFLV